LAFPTRRREFRGSDAGLKGGDNKMSVTEEIHHRLQAAFSPVTLDVVDESEQHRGHGGWREGGNTHFRVVMTAPVFGPMTRLDRHRAVHAALGADLVARIHALALEVAG